jgi:hypothetical protein
VIQTLVRKFGGLVDIQGWFPGAVLARKADNTGFEWVVMSSGGGGVSQVSSDWNATSGFTMILNKPTIPTTPSQIGAEPANANIQTHVTSPHAPANAQRNVQADWNAVAGDSLILNKPTIPTQYTDTLADLRVVAGITNKVDKVTGKDLSTNDYTTVEKNKLAGIASGAEVNVNADWNATNGDAQILNKPSIPTQYTDAMADARVVAGITGKVDNTVTVNGQALSSNVTLAAIDIGYTDPTLTNVKLALDQHTSLLSLLAPAKPANLSANTMSVAGTYTAKESSTGTVRSGIINSTTPTVTCSAAFYDGDSGTLTALVDSLASGSRVLTTADDSGTYTWLRILTDTDPYVGQFGKQGFYKQLTASIVPAAQTLKVAHTFALSHSSTGTTPALTIYCDNPSTPNITAQAVSGVLHTSLKRLSGIPCLASGDVIQASCTGNLTTHSFYNSTRVIAFSGANITTLNYTPGTPPTSGAAVATGTQNLTVSAGSSTGAVITCTAYNSIGTTGTANINSSVRVSVSATETIRVKSGTTDMPAGGYGAAYDSSELLTANSELQMEVDGRFLYPPATNYTGVMPAGPNYSTGLGASDRYATFNLGAFNGTSRTITINGAVNFGASALIAGLKMWAKVDSVTGWVDLNAAYPGVGNPFGNGDPALVVASSTATSRALTFGSAVRVGTLFVRIALPSGSTKTFTSVS